MVLFLSLVEPAYRWDNFVGEEKVICSAFLWFVACVLYIMVCLLFRLVSSVDLCVCVRACVRACVCVISLFRYILYTI